MRKLELLIQQIRRQTENQEFSDTTGISDEEFIQYFNDAQDDLIQAIQMNHPSVLEKEVIQQCVAGQEVYALPSDVFLGTRIRQIDYTPTGTDTDYFRLKQGHLGERYPGFGSEPAYYIRRSTDILLEPKPQSSRGKIRLTYQKTLPKLDTTKAKIAAVTTLGTQITALTLDLGTEIDKEHLIEDNYFTVIDKFGAVTMQAILFDDIDDTTGIVTIDPAYNFTVGETIAAGSYLTRSKYSSNVSILPDLCERFLLSHCGWKIFARSSSNDSQDAKTERDIALEVILASFSEPDDDTKYIPVLDASFLDVEQI